MYRASVNGGAVKELGVEMCAKGPAHRKKHAHTRRPVDELGRQASEWTQTGAVPAG